MIQRKFQIYFTYFITLFLILPLYARSDSSDAKQVLPDDYGYLLIEMDVGANSASMTYAKIALGLTSLAKRTQPLKTVDARFLLVPLAKGRYQVTDINVPLFDLPYRYRTAKQKHWEFSVQPGAVNYFGKLTIDAERSTDSVSVTRHNQIAKALAEIRQQYADILARYPLVSASSYRDDFYQEIAPNNKEQ